MTQTRLPRRPIGELPPPPGGLTEVRRAARLRRRRKSAIVAGGGSLVAVVVTVVMLVGGGAGIDVLKTVQPAVTPAPSPGVSPAIAAPAQPHTARQSSAAHKAVPGTGPVLPAAGASSSTHSLGADSTAAPRPQLVRTQRMSTTGGVTFCSEGATVDSNENIQESVGWCLAAVTRRVSGGEQLTVDLCRDGSSGGTLTFDTTREVDLTVQRAGRTVWDWARDHPAQRDPHQLSVSSHGCFDWTLVWPGISQNGVPTGHGTFTFIATSAAKELAAANPASTTFTL